MTLSVAQCDTRPEYVLGSLVVGLILAHRHKPVGMSSRVGDFFLPPSLSRGRCLILLARVISGLQTRALALRRVSAGPVRVA